MKKIWTRLLKSQAAIICCVFIGIAIYQQDKFMMGLWSGLLITYLRWNVELNG